MIVAVTGSTGFIGSQLCRALVAAGHQVLAFHRPASPLSALHDLPVEHRVGDLTQPATLLPALQGAEVVFHTAAQLGRTPDRRMYTSVTVEGTRNLLHAAREAGVRRVVHTSSVAALGVPEQAPGLNAPTLMNEYHTWNFQPEYWPYGYAKYQAELAVQAEVACGLEVVIVNPTVVLGPGDLNQVSGNVLLQVARRRVPVATRGGLNVVHIADVVKGHLAAMELGRSGERYILCGENLTHISFLRLAAAAAEVPPPWFTFPGRVARALAAPLNLAGRWVPLPVSGDALLRAGMYFYYDSRKAQTELGLEAPLPASQAIGDALDWYRHQGRV